MKRSGGKYEALGTYLARSSRSVIAMKFEEVETIIQAQLPPSAYAHRPWWSNNPSNNAMTRVWLDAGFESEGVDMRERRLVFRRMRAISPPVDRASGVAALFGKLRGLVRFEPGYDFTQPAAPEMADLADNRYGAQPRARR